MWLGSGDLISDLMTELFQTRMAASFFKDRRHFRVLGVIKKKVITEMFICCFLLLLYLDHT